MATTQSWLETYSDGRVAMSLAFDGYDLVYTTASPSEISGSGGVAEAWSTVSQWSNVKSGLHIAGQMEQKIQLFAQDIEADTLDFTITDYDDTLLQAVLTESLSTAGSTYLTANLDADDVTATAKDTAAFGASGTVYCGHEEMSYSGKTATTFTGLTRGVRSLFGTSSDPGSFGRGHYFGSNTTENGASRPNVRTKPRTWYNRIVALYLHHYDPVDGSWSNRDNSRLLWAGRIQSYRDNPDGSITISCKHVIDVLRTPVFGEQWRATLLEGMYFGSGSVSPDYYRGKIGIWSNTKSPVYNLEFDTALSGQKTHSDVAAAINDQLGAWKASGSYDTGEAWSLELLDSGSGPRYAFRLIDTGSIVDGVDVFVRLHPDVWWLLGWDPKGLPWSRFSDDRPYVEMRMGRKSSGELHLVAPRAPVVVLNAGMYHGDQIGIENEIGEYYSLPGLVPEYVAADGLVSFGETIYAVTKSAGLLTLWYQFDHQSRTFQPLKHAILQDGEPDYDARRTEIRMDQSSSPPEIKQVWYEQGSAGTLFAKLLLSTGASGYNHPTYDSYTARGFGMAVPYGLIDLDTVLALNEAQIELYLDGPRPFNEIAEPVLALTNKYFVFKSRDAASQPKITVVPLGQESPNLPTAWFLTESNKAEADSGPDRATVERSPDGIINRAIVEYGGHLGGGSGGSKIIVEEMASQSDFGRRRTVTIKANNVLNADALTVQATAPALAYFSRPLAITERSIDFSLTRMAPGDAVLLTDNFMVNPSTGVRGVTNLPCWCLATRFDWKTGRGKVQLVFNPERDPTRMGLWGVSARVDETAGGSGYNAGTKTLTLKQHEFSSSDAPADALGFVNGDKVHVYAIDEASPLEWFDTINGTPTATTIVLTTGLAGFDTAKRYVIELDDVNTVLSAARKHAFVADDADLSTGFSSSPQPYQWGIDVMYPFITGATIDYTKGVSTPNSTYDDKGEPLSSAKGNYLALGANNLLGYTTSNEVLADYTPTEQSQVGTTPKLVYGPVFVPLYGHTSRSVTFKIRGRQSGAGTANYKIVSATGVLTGTSYTSFSYPGATTTVTASTTSSTNTWTSEVSMVPSFGYLGTTGMRGTWITVEAYGSAGGITAFFNAISAVESSL